MNIVEYQHEAANAQTMASRSSSAAEKAAWLCVAHGWLSLWKQGDTGLTGSQKRDSRTTGIPRRNKCKLKLRSRNGKDLRHNKSNERHLRKARRKTA